MPTKETIHAAEEMIINEEVCRLDTLMLEAFQEGNNDRYKSLLPVREDAKKRCMNAIRVRFPGEFKQPGRFIEHTLSNRVR